MSRYGRRPPTAPGQTWEWQLRGVLERSQGRRLAAIVLASDGQTTHDPAASAILKDAVQDVAGRQIPIHALRIGSPVPPLDVEIGPLRAVERAFVNDVVAVGATLSAGRRASDAGAFD